jgi:hypothetical protein
MYCPRCGNHSAPGRARFCPSCGLRLDGVVDLLARDDNPANPSVAQEPSARKRGIRQGAKLCFISFTAFLPIFGFAAAMNSEALLSLLLLPATSFLAGIFWMIYFKLFVDEHESPIKNTQVVAAPPASHQSYLPQPQAVPVYRPPIEQPQPQSVVENTTRSLGSE